MGTILKSMTLNAMIAALVLIGSLMLIGTHKDGAVKSCMETVACNGAGTAD